MKYKLIVLDIDGTLAKNHSKISSFNISAVNQAAKKGLEIVIATGRSPYNTELITKQFGDLNKDIIQISFNGSVINKFQDNRVVKSYFDYEKSKIIMDLCNDLNIAFWGYSYKSDNEGYVGNRKNFIVKFLSKKTKRKAIKFNNQEQVECWKFMISGSHKSVNKLINEIKNVMECSVFDSSYIGPKYKMIEISPKHTDKVYAIQDVCAAKGIEASEVICMGDGNNDLEMLKWAGLGIAMSNAKSTIKENANYITDTNKKNGVGKAIHKFVL